MSIGPYWVHPTTDIHLVQGGPSMALRLFQIFDENGVRSWQEVSAAASHAFKPAQPSIVTVTPGGDFTPNGLGTTTVRVERAESATVAGLRAIVRVSVHAGVQRIWAGNNRVTMHSGSSNYVLSVYAAFTDGTIADISGHPYLRYQSDTSLVTVGADGRISSRGTSAGTPVAIDLQGLGQNLTPVTVDVRVIDPTVELVPSLVPLHGSAKLANRRNILLVTEGLGAASMAGFRKDVADEIARRLFRTKSHSPFRLLKRSINLWLAMQPSPEEGITVGPSIEIKNSAAEPFEPTPANSILPAGLFPLQARDSYFGLMYGSRLGGPRARLWPSAATDLVEWMQPTFAARGFSVDYRRLPDLIDDPNSLARAQFDAFLDRLGPDAIHWKTGGRDAGLVCFLVNDDFRGGQRLPDDSAVAAAVGDIDFLLDSLSNPPLHSGRLFWDHEPRVSAPRPNIEALTAVVTHELAHSPVFQLGDEYENDSGPGRQISSGEADQLETFVNLHTSRSIGNPASISANDIKWNFHRIAAAAVLSGPPVVRPGNVVALPFEDGAEGAWPVGAEAFLRDPSSPFGRNPSFPLELTAFDAVAREALLVPTGGRPLAPDYHLGTFGKGSLLYLPKMVGGSPLFLVDADILTDLSNNGVFGRLTGAQCIGTDPAPPDNPAGDPNGARRPRLVPKSKSITVPDYEVLGFYEGGGGLRCEVYRPAGWCRERRSYDRKKGAHVGFCFVCKYTIVEAINPARHPTLDREDYPE